MPNPKNPTRREWFRLRKTSASITLGNDNFPPAQSNLEPIEHPPNHDGMNLADLPPMREAILSADQIAALFSDIALLGTDIMLMQRANHVQRAKASQPNSKELLEIAKASLVNSEVKRVQIRYRWQNMLWIDTISTVPAGYRIVRIAHRTS